MIPHSGAQLTMSSLFCRVESEGNQYHARTSSSSSTASTSTCRKGKYAGAFSRSHSTASNTSSVPSIVPVAEAARASESSV